MLLNYPSTPLYSAPNKRTNTDFVANETKSEHSIPATPNTVFFRDFPTLVWTFSVLFTYPQAVFQSVNDFSQLSI